MSALSKSLFETVIGTPEDSSFKLMCVRFQWSKTVAGVLEYYYNGGLIHKLAKKTKRQNRLLKNTAANN